jgi:hypothetical protein
MSEQMHTPGPWFTSQPHGTIYIEARLRGSTLQEVAACGPTEAEGQREANARLIAAAPELLDALVFAEEWLTRAEALLDRGEDDSPNFEPAILMARAAIARARGVK